MTVAILPVTGLPEIRPGDDLAEMIIRACRQAEGPGLLAGDVLVIASKVVSKAEGRVVRDRDREDVIDEETVRVVSEWSGRSGRTVIAETRHGLVLAAAGVDASNVEPGNLVLLPTDPDMSAMNLRRFIEAQTGVRVAVIVSDTAGRPWRVGQVDIAVGCSGLGVLDDLAGTTDGYGNPLSVTRRAIADEIAAAADLVSGKTARIPAVVVRGLHEHGLGDGENDEPATTLVRPAAEDRFRFGTTEAARHAVTSRRSIRRFAADPVSDAQMARCIEAAFTAPSPHDTRPWRYVLVSSAEARDRLLRGMRQQWAADLESDGWSPVDAERRIRRGLILDSAPRLVVPCLVEQGLHDYPDSRRSEAERALFVLSMGASVQNLLLALSAEGLGATWIGSTLFCPHVARVALELPSHWKPMGCVAAGWPAEVPPPRREASPCESWIIR